MRSTSTSTPAHWSLSTSSRQPIEPALSSRGEAVAARGEMRCELIPRIFREELLGCGMIAANNHQVG